MLPCRCLVLVLLSFAACDDRNEATRLCDDCPEGTVCVQRFDGTCGSSVTCEVRAEGCEDNVCSTACNVEHCNFGAVSTRFSCFSGGPCEDAATNALLCYGP